MKSENSTSVFDLRILAKSAIYSSYYCWLSGSFGTASLSLAFSSALRSHCYLMHSLRAVTAGLSKHLLRSIFLSVLMG